MIKINYLFFDVFFVIFIIFPAMCFSQISVSVDEKTYSKKLFYPDTSISLPNTFILKNSERVFYGEKKILIKNSDYSINYITGKILLFDLKGKDTCIIKIDYKILPTDLNIEYFLHEKIYSTDSNINRFKLTESRYSISSTKEIFGDKITKTGSLTRGFSFGSTKDLTLNSGFRLQMQGNLSEDMTIIASLTDEKIPILPEGNTQTIKDFDKVFIDINHKNFNLTLGDFYHENSLGLLGNFKRKLQGGRINFNFDNIYGSVAYASTPGKFTNNEFYGLDGIQGPYPLKSSNGELDIIVIPGSERVFIDGKLLKRGDLEDYTIDYNRSEILFTIRNIIKNNTRISIDFEYTDQKYNRNVFSTKIGAFLFNNKMNTSIALFQEGDDNSSPLNFELNSDIKQIIQRAGNDQQKSAISGAIFVGNDSVSGIGKGQYYKIDTTINSISYSFFVYAPGTKDAKYSLNFSIVGDNKGDYVKESIGNYRWVGIGKGQYMPIKQFSLPDRKRIATWNLNAEIFSGLNISSEFAISNNDMNTLSSIDDADNNGNAYNINIDFKHDSIKILKYNLGQAKFNLFGNHISRNFSSIERIDEIDYYRNWNISDSNKHEKDILTFRSFYKPLNLLNFNYNWGVNKYALTNKSVKNEYAINFGDSTVPKITLNIIDIINDQVSSNNDFKYFKSTFNYNFYGIELLSFFNREKKMLLLNRKDLINGYQYDIFSAQASILGSSFVKISYGLELQSDKLVLNNILSDEAKRKMHTINFEFSDKSNFNSSLIIGYQSKTYNKKFEILGKKGFDNLLLKSLVHYSAFRSGIECNLFYETSKENSAILQRVYIRVEKGQGNYQYLGDINKNGIADEDEFVQVKYDGDFVPISIKTATFIPVTDLKSSFRLKISPSKFILRSNNFFETVLTTISSETYLQINEMNKNELSKDIFLMKLNKFQDERMTIKGNINFTQDLFLFDNIDYFNLRLRYNERKSLNQYNFGFEKRFLIDRGIRIRFRFLEEISNQSDINKVNDLSISPGVENRSYILSSISYVSNFSYRPEKSMEISFRIEGNTKSDEIQKIEASKNQQSIRLNYAIMNKGNFQIELERSEIIFTSTPKYIPYNLTDGLSEGKTINLKSNFDYHIYSFIQCSFFYLGRYEKNKNILHNASLEMKLFF